MNVLSKIEIDGEEYILAADTVPDGSVTKEKLSPAVLAMIERGGSGGVSSGGSTVEKPNASMTFATEADMQAWIDTKKLSSNTNLTNTTWTFNESLTFSVTETTNFNVDFTFNGIVCNIFRLFTTWFGYKSGTVQFEYKDGTDSVYAYDEWQVDARTITFTGGEDATNANLIAFMQDNATITEGSNNYDIAIDEKFYVTETRSVYQWDGSKMVFVEVVSGGGNGTLTDDFLDFVTFDETKAVAVTTNITDGYSLGFEGQKQTEKWGQITDPIDVLEGETYLITTTCASWTAMLCEYDADDNFVGYFGKVSSLTDFINEEYTVPSGVSKIIVSNASKNQTTNFNVKKVYNITVKDKITELEESIDEPLEINNVFSMGSASDWAVVGASISIDGYAMHVEKTNTSVSYIEVEKSNVPLVEEAGKKVFFYFEHRTKPAYSYGFNGEIRTVTSNGLKVKSKRGDCDYFPCYGLFELTENSNDSQRVRFMCSTSDMVGVENTYDIRNVFISDSIQGFDDDYTEKLYLAILSKNGHFEGKKSFISSNDYLNLLESFEDDDTTLIAEKTVTVGVGGDFQSLNGALRYLSKFYPTYTEGGLNCYIKILSGTTIAEQIQIQRIDLSYITIIAEDAEVPVDASAFAIRGLDEHDLRGNVAFIGGENAAQLPVVGCLFKLIKQPNLNFGVVGCFANRGSNGVVLANSGFDGFNDGVIANNESSITIRQGIARNSTRWGVHARHNGEVSARSCDLSNSGEIAAYADRVANLDAREANVNGSKMAFAAYHGSIVNGNMDSTIDGCGEGANAVVHCKNGSTINVCNTKFANCKATIIKVEEGGIVSANGISASGSASGVETYSQTVNTITANGVIFG